MMEAVRLSLAQRMRKAANEVYVTETNAGAPFANSMAEWSVEVEEMQKEANTLGAYQNVTYNRNSPQVTIEFYSQEDALKAWHVLHKMWASAVTPPVDTNPTPPAGPLFISYNLVTGVELFRGYNCDKIVASTLYAATSGGVGLRDGVMDNPLVGLYYELIQFNNEIPNTGSLLYQTVGIGLPVSRGFFPKDPRTIAPIRPKELPPVAPRTR